MRPPRLSVWLCGLAIGGRRFLHRVCDRGLDQRRRRLPCHGDDVGELGYPDRAFRLSEEKDNHARRRGHPFDLGHALVAGVHEFDHRFTHEDLRRRADECERLGRENSLPVLWAFVAPMSYGLALIREGKVAEGIAPLKTNIASWGASGGKLRSPTVKAFLAEGMALNGDLENALHLIDEQIVQVERPGWEERQSYAEMIQRLKGWMLSLKGDFWPVIIQNSHRIGSSPNSRRPAIS
jgi:hypothetical protein